MNESFNHNYERLSSYVGNGKNDTGPIKQNAKAISVLPIKADTFGCKNLSTIHPHTGAVTAQNPPFIIKTIPVEIKTKIQDIGFPVRFD